MPLPLNRAHAAAPPRAAEAARYGLLGLPLAFVALPVYVHLPNHYAQQYGVALAALGGVLLGSRVIDAVADPMLGRAGDALYRRSWRAVLGAAALMAALMVAGFAALFFPPALPTAALLVWAAAALTLSHLSYSGLGILHQAWAARQGGGAVAQSRWVGWREGLGLLGVLLASALPSLAGWGATTALLAVALVLGLITWNAAAQRAGGAPGTSACMTPEPPAGLWSPWRHQAFRRLLAVFMINGLASALPATLLLFFTQDRLQAPRALEPVFLGLYFAAGALGLPLWLMLVGRIGLARTWLAGMALSLLAFAGVLTLGPGDSLLFMAICVASGLALGADLAVPGAMLNRVIDRCGERGRSEGAFMGWWNLAVKLNLALAAGLALPLLAAWGYAPGRQDATAQAALGLAYGALPCVLKLLAAATLWWSQLRTPTQTE